MANFPSSPTDLQVHTEYGRSYTFYSLLGVWIATRGDFDFVKNQLQLDTVSGTSPVNLTNGTTYNPVSTPYLVTNRVWKSASFDPPLVPAPTIGISGSSQNLSEQLTRSFTINMTDDTDNIAQVTIVSGGGSLNSTSIAPGGSVLYTPVNVAVNTSVTIRATATNFRGVSATNDMVFTVTDTPAATVAISGNITDLQPGTSRVLTVTHVGDINDSVQIDIISGGGTINTSAVANGGTFTYSSGAYSGAVTIRARAINYDGEITDTTVTLNVIPPIVYASGGSNINGNIGLQQIRTSSYISSGGTFEIPSNYWIWSDSTSVAALIIDTPNATVINRGKIIGRGGDGGNGGSTHGGAGGPAISVTASGVTIQNISGAYIAGGGGGGGAGNSGPANSGGGGGAGGGRGGARNGGPTTAGGAIGQVGTVSGNGIAAGGAGGAGGWADYQKENASPGGSGGRILPGVGGTSMNGWVNGGSANNPGVGQSNSAFNSWGAGGGGWGAPGGTSRGTSGGAGGAAISGLSRTLSNSGTIYGST